MVGDLVQFTYTNITQGTQILTITAANASLLFKVGGIPVAIQGTLMSDGSVSVGLPPQVIVNTT